MKKILSSILAAATIASVAVFPATAEDTVTKGTSVSVDAYYFTEAAADSIVFDGDIKAEEWGEKTITVSGATAAKPGDTAPAATNVYAWYGYKLDATNTKIETEETAAKEKVLGMTYDLWLRWDEDYMYIAAKVNDPDGYYLPAGREKIWDGDCLQLRIDPMGPNSYQSYKNPDYDYKTTAFDVNAASVTSYQPWAYTTKICNIGFGMVNGKAQAYDMADQGTGNMTRPQLINDPGKLGPNANPFGDDKNYATEFGMTTIPNENGVGCVNTYEAAIPWAFLDQWGFGQVAVGYAWGMSVVVLNGYDDNDTNTDAYISYLTWGSGICGSQQDVAFERATCGGSNAVVLSDKDALDPTKTVEGLPQAKDDDIVTEVTHNILNGTSMNAYYLTATDETPAVDGNYSVSADIAYLGDHALTPEKSHIGFMIGENYGMIAGWDAETHEFFVAESLWDNGINKAIPYAKSEETFDWPVGEWHNLGVTVVGETVTVTFDGEVVVEDTDKRNVCTTTGNNGTYEVLMYNLGKFVFDNYKLSYGEETVEYTFNTDDEVFMRSDFRLQAMPSFYSVEKGECKVANPESEYGCLFRQGVNADGKTVTMCEYCGTESTTYGDANGDGKINTADVTILLKHIAKWDVTVDEVAANVNGDDKINTADVTLLMKYIAKWDVTLGPKA